MNNLSHAVKKKAEHFIKPLANQALTCQGYNVWVKTQQSHAPPLVLRAFSCFSAFLTRDVNILFCLVQRGLHLNNACWGTNSDTHAPYLCLPTIYFVIWSTLRKEEEIQTTSDLQVLNVSLPVNCAWEVFWVFEGLWINAGQRPICILSVPFSYYSQFFAQIWAP